MAITIAEKARARINNLADKRGSRSLIFAVRGGGCVGFSYRFDFATDKEYEEIQKNIDDGELDKRWKVFGFDQFEILVPIKAYFFVNGTEIDWIEETMGHRFVFNNPNVDSACGCGSSVSFKVGE